MKTKKACISCSRKTIQAEAVWGIWQLCQERSELSLLAKIAVLKAEEIKHAVDADGVEALLCVSHHTRFGMEGDAKSGFAQHRQVVGSVAHGNGLCEVHLLHLCDKLQQFC